MTAEGAAAPDSSRWRTIALVAGVAVIAGLGGVLIAGRMQTASTPAAAPPAQPRLVPPQHAALPRMQVQAVYSGPLQDTVIQRLRDPVDGTICYVYSAIAVHHTPPSNETGYVEYNANSIGSISCYAPTVTVRVAPPAPTRPAAPAAPPAQ
jgi:hypothetical protein